MISQDQEMELKANNKLKDFVIKRLIFIDTCSLMHEHATEFWRHITPLLKEYAKSVIVPYRCQQELEKISKAIQKEKREKAQKALNELETLEKKRVVERRGELSDNELADNVFLTQFRRLNMKYDLLLITQDKTLGKEILDLNSSRASRGKKIIVSQINKYGFLSPLVMKDDISSHRKPIEKENKENKKIPQDEIFPTANKIKEYSDNENRLNIVDIPREGENVVCLGKRIILEKQIGGGGEGNIYTTNTPFVAKIYKKEKITKSKFEKLQLMVSKHISCEGICFPIAIVYNLNKEFVGYLMPKAEGKELQKSIFIKPLFEKIFPNWKKRDTVELCITILKKIKYLNDRNIILGDINPANILVVSPQKVYLVDTDSYQVGGFPCPVGMVNFTAPEIQGKTYSKFLRTKGNEQFAIATLLFMIMVPGKPPYAQQGGENQATNIINMDFSYPLGEISNGKTPDGPWRFIWSHLTYKIKEAFYNTFKKGGHYSTENRRLAPEDWIRLFSDYLNLLDSGKYGRQDKMSEILFPTRFKKNPNNIYKKCILCGQEFEEKSLKEGICTNCLRQGEEYQCARCGTRMFYSNYDKYIKKKKKYEICYDCLQKSKMKSRRQHFPFWFGK